MECPKLIHLIETESDVKDPPDDPKENETEEVEETGPVKGLVSLIILKEATLTTEKKWLRNNIFLSKGTVNSQTCMVVIDRGSCENIISLALVD